MRSCLQEGNLQEYLDGELTAEASEAVRAHLAACARCAATVRGMEQAFTAISAAVEGELPDAVPTARLRARIESALAEKAAPEPSWAQLFWRFGAIAAAMPVIAGALGWFVLRTHSGSTPKPVPQARAGAPAPTVTPSEQTPSTMPPALGRGPEAAGQPATSRPRQRVRRRASGNSLDEAEVVTEFFPLREGEDVSALENVRLVRVELPSSALGEVGLPFDPQTANGPVKADVVLGEDGLARAIRFVR